MLLTFYWHFIYSWIFYEISNWRKEWHRESQKLHFTTPRIIRWCVFLVCLVCKWIVVRVLKKSKTPELLSKLRNCSEALWNLKLKRKRWHHDGATTTVTWRWTTDVLETRPVVYRLTKRGIKGMLFEKKVIFLLRSREIAWLRQCIRNYGTTSPFYIASF